MTSLGIDVAGAPGKALTIALVRWGAEVGAPASVAWDAVLLGRPGAGYPSFPWTRIVHAVSQGNLALVSTLSYPIADHVSHGLQAAVVRLGVPHAIDVAVDSPSGFSRNTLGHGRATEKVGRFFGLGGQHQAYFQMTPSIACGRPRGNQWAWMLFGMATFHAVATNFSVSQPSWESYLRYGFGKVPGGLGGKIIEVFPRATIQHLRVVFQQQPQKMAAILGTIGALTGATTEAALIAASFGNGNRTKSDRADALLAALTTLGKVYPQTFKMVGLTHPQPSNYAAPGPVPWAEEGVVYVLG